MIARKVLEVHPPHLCKHMRVLRGMSVIVLAKAIRALPRKAGKESEPFPGSIDETCLAIETFESMEPGSFMWARAKEFGAIEWMGAVLNATKATVEEIENFALLTSPGEVLS